MSSAARLFGKPIPSPVPPEFANATSLVVYLGLGPNELKKIWWVRARIYDHFSITKGMSQVRLISAPDRRLNMPQSKRAPLFNP